MKFLTRMVLCVLSALTTLTLLKNGKGLGQSGQRAGQGLGYEFYRLIHFAGMWIRINNARVIIIHSIKNLTFMLSICELYIRQYIFVGFKIYSTHCINFMFQTCMPLIVKDILDTVNGLVKV